MSLRRPCATTGVSLRTAGSTVAAGQATRRPGRLNSGLRTSACVALAAVWLGGGGCSRSPGGHWQGYLEAELVRVSSPLAGTLNALSVQRGDVVAAGQALFQLERSADEAAVREAAERLRQARSRLENLTKGRRPSELEAIAARLAQARVTLELAEREYRRADGLWRDGALARSALDQAQAALDGSRRRVEEGEAELVTARLGAREDEVRAGEADVAAAEAALARAQWAVEQKQKAAPAAGLVQDTYYRPGEWVAAGAPVLALLPPENLKARFFVPEGQVASLRVGQEVKLRLDGNPTPRTARVAYISPQPEYTPPVIYSQENRAKLVFLVEARFAPVEPGTLHPGLPVDVALP